MRTHAWVASCALAFLSLHAVSAQTSDFTPLDRYLTQVAAEIPSGFEVAIVQHGREIYWKQYGPWTRNRQASIASATKWYSGAVILSLVDDGILSLDDRASRYLPYMTGEKQSITIRQLMSHTAGFPGEFPVADPCLNDAADTLAHCAEALARVPLQAPPGTAFIYAGAGMQIAGRVAEVASGKDWQTLFRDRIAQPLGMTATDYEYQGPTHNPRISGGGRSTVSDSMRFLSMIRQRGVFEGRRILSPRAVDAMLADQTRGVPIVESPFGDSAPQNRYGIGNWVEAPGSTPGTTQNSSIGLAGWTPLFDAGRDLQVVVGMQSALRPFQPHYFEMKRIVQELIPPAPLTAAGITNAASYEPGAIAPGELLAVFGRGLGPELPLSSAGETSLGGTEVTFDGVPGLLLYASTRQLTVLAPAAVAGKAGVQVVVTANGTRLPAVVAPVAAAWPALFAADATGAGPGVIRNQDGSLNSVANPALRGSTVQLFGSGACLTEGTPAPAVLVTMGGQAAAISFCGPAAGLPAGVFQVNATVPGETAPSGAAPVIIQAAGHASLPVVTIAVR